MNNANIPIIGQKTNRKIGEITLPQPDGTFVEVQASAVVAMAPEVVAAIASGILAALASRGLSITESQEDIERDASEDDKDYAPTV